MKVIRQAVQVVAGALRDEFNLIANKMAVKAFRDAVKWRLDLTVQVRYPGHADQRLLPAASDA